MSDIQSNNNYDKNRKKTLILQTIGFFAKAKRMKLIKLNVIRKYIEDLEEQEELVLKEISECNSRIYKEYINNVDLLKGDINIIDSDEEETGI